MPWIVQMLAQSMMVFGFVITCCLVLISPDMSWESREFEELVPESVGSWSGWFKKKNHTYDLSDKWVNTDRWDMMTSGVTIIWSCWMWWSYRANEKNIFFWFRIEFFLGWSLAVSTSVRRKISVHLRLRLNAGWVPEECFFLNLFPILEPYH